MAEQHRESLSSCPLPLASLPDGALATIFWYVSVGDILIANSVCRSWVITGDRVDLWKALGEIFEVTMPTSLRPQLGSTGGIHRQKRILRSATNAKRTFLKSYMGTVTAHGVNQDATLSEAYTLFRHKDSVPRLRALLRRRWGLFPTNRLTEVPSAARDRPTDSAGSGCWTLNINHRHTIYESNTILNFAARCGRRKCVDFLVRCMGADTEVPDDGGFTPLLNAAWRGDALLLQQLYEAGASLDVKGVSRGEGPYGPLEWAERKNRPITAAYLVRLQRAAAEEDEDDRGDGGNADGGRIKRRRRGLPRLGAIPDDIGGGSGSGGGGSSSGGSGGFEGGGPPRLEGHF